MGIDRVHFLDELHAKVFIGQKFAMVGSANLSANAAETLREVMVKISDVSSVVTLREWFADTVMRSTDRYPSAAKKEEKLAALQRLHNRAIRSGLMRHASPPDADSSLAKYLSQRVASTEPLFPIQWWSEAGDDTEEFASDIAKRGLSPSQVHDKIDVTSGDASEEVVDSWVLCWRLTKSGTVSGKLDWLYVDGIASSGDDEFPRTIFMLNGKDRPLPPKPFELERPVRAAFKRTMNDKQWDEKRACDNAAWIKKEPMSGKSYRLIFLERWRDNVK